jgi:hypothetical protein
MTSYIEQRDDYWIVKDEGYGNALVIKTSCPGLLDLSPIGHLAELRKLTIEDCHELKSLSPISKCKKLEFLQIAGNTVVLDGDLSSLNRLPKLKKILLADRKHYSHTADELMKDCCKKAENR